VGQDPGEQLAGHQGPEQQQGALEPSGVGEGTTVQMAGVIVGHRLKIRTPEDRQGVSARVRLRSVI